MTLGFCSFASSSSGNSYLIKSETTSLLVDVGISAAQIMSRLAGLEMEAQDIDGVLLTHEHMDHVKSVSAFHKKAPKAHFVTSEGTFCALEERVQKAVAANLTVIEGKGQFFIGDILVTHFSLSHDAAEPMAYAFEKDGKKVAVVTDTGVITEEIFEAVANADILALEANHEENILLYGRYPYQVKRRILSDRGHLSNEAAGNCLTRILKRLRDGGSEKVPRVYLAHLSKENNTPQQAFLTVRNVLEEQDFYIGKDITLEVITADDPMGLAVI
ncbi:MAG: MBL fold metallo-hydrolase [Firmicutes bacterium]|nr:MBL fold metallo-hydrolase [Bacillota bacterium]